jgi:anti-sigma-K factor RskA
MNSDRIDELIALAALGELSESERRELDVAAQSDPSVAGELDAALAAAAALQRPHAEQPPAALRNSVLSAIASTPQEEIAPAEAPAITPAVSLDEERERRRFRPAILAVAAVVALFVAGGLVLVAQTDDPSDPIAAVVEAPDASSRRLVGDIETLTAVYSPSEGALVIQGESVPVLDDTETYQLWLVDDDVATSVGIFRPDADGAVAERFAGADPTGFVIGVTEEPAGGSESPTLPILASA